jgi:hypothetical protein
MADAGQQQVIAKEHGWRFALKHGARTFIREHDGIRTVAARLTDARAWGEGTLTPANRKNRAYIKQFKDLHAGRRCVIIGNGPSLKHTDLSLLQNEFTFGLNRIYLLFDELGFETTYHVVVNKLVVEQCAEDFRRIKAPLFTTTANRKFLADADNIAYLSRLVGPRFCCDASRGIWEGATVTYAAMQIAYYMGFTQVVLVGVDHRFAVAGTPNQIVESSGPDASHFDTRYFAKGFRWQLPDLERSELAYSLARRAFEKDGRSIVDATVDGALTVFPKMPLEEALGL